MSEKYWKLDKVVYTFSQTANTNGTTGEDEELTITHESVVDCLVEDEGFYVVRTDGWSIDSENELVDLFEEVLSDKVINQQEFLNANLIRKLKEDYLSNRLEDFERLWFVFVFLQWYKKWHQ